MHGGKVSLDELLGLMGNVQVHAIDAEALHFVVDGARDDVPGRELATRVELTHEGSPVGQ